MGRTFGLGAVLLVCVTSACGSSSSSATPTGIFADLSGSWTGTFESSNFATRTVSVTVVQTTNCVDGAWISSTADWHGAISGLATIDSLPGFLSFERSASGGGQCDATAPVNASILQGTFRLTADTLTPVGDCTGDLPRQIVITLHR